jgi:hypothetical protein
MSLAFLIKNKNAISTCLKLKTNLKILTSEIFIYVFTQIISKYDIYMTLMYNEDLTKYLMFVRTDRLIHIVLLA